MNDGRGLSAPVRWLLCLLPASLVLVMALPSLGYRHLFVDEAETGARAITILESGLPRSREADGTLSLSGGGIEVEDGYLHRYTPWVQFYVAASGLVVGDALGLERDASVRLPFITAHAAGASVLQWGLASVAGVHPVVAAVAATTYGLHSGRLLLNRTARYHAIVDLLVIVGMVALAVRARRRSGSSPVVSLVLILLPHTHTLGGSLAGGCLVLAAWFVALERHPSSASRGIAQLWPGGRGPRDVLLGAMLPLAFGLGTVVALSRPWAQGAWRRGIPHQPAWSVFYTGFVEYAVWGAAILIAFMVLRRARLAAVLFTSTIVIAIFLMTFLDFIYPFSQFRYYTFLSTFVAGFSLISPALLTDTTRLGPFKPAQLVGFIVLVMFAMGEVEAGGGPGHGVRVVLNDRRLQAEESPQPLRQAIARIAADPGGSPVSIDYVPQYINWYLPGRDVALLPDPGDRTILNEHMSMWGEPVALPVWDLHYPQDQPGTWHCRASRACAFVRIPDPQLGRYRFRFRDGTFGPLMCVVDVWMADPINHSIFTLASTAAFSGAGRATSPMVLGRQCDLAAVASVAGP